MSTRRFKYMVTRRQFLRRTGTAGLAATGLVLGLSACGGDNETSAKNSGTKTTAGQAAQPDDPCSDLSGLTPDEKNMRNTFQYTAVAKDPAKPCKTCNFWQSPTEGSVCGGCTLMKGPINPEGGCISWAEVQKT